MNFSESFIQALDSLKSNKLRSFLTMLGIVMGVFSIITIMALGSATESYMNAQFEKIGANTISITYKNMNVDKKDWLTLKDMEYVKEAAPEIKNISTNIQKRVPSVSMTKQRMPWCWVFPHSSRILASSK